MKKRLLSVFTALALSCSMLPVNALAVENNTVYGVVDLGTTETSASNSISLFSSADGIVDITNGEHVKWIDRIDVPAFAKELYNSLVEASSHDGALVNPELLSSQTVGDDTIYGYKLDTTGYSQEYVEKCIRAAFDAFDRDHPEVFWLSGRTMLYTSGNTAYFPLLVKGGNFDIRDTSTYANVDAIKAAITERDNAINKIMSGEYPANGTDAEKVAYFDKWLTANNEYNTDLSNASQTTHECISALKGGIGASGPVCEGYARALKVLCDKAGIGCVLVDGQAKSSTSNSAEAHMWNYVQLDDDNWYAVDTTWNDPIVNGGTVSGERQDYLFVGSNTQVGGQNFINSHPVSNEASVNGVAFTNQPTLSKTAYVKDITNNSVKNEYKIGESFDLKGVTATYWYTQNKQQVTVDLYNIKDDVQVTPVTFENVGQQNVTVSYSGGKITIPINVIDTTIKGTVNLSVNNAENSVQTGTVITATANIENNISVNYQWYVNDSAVDGETNSSYTVKDGDKTIYVIVTPQSTEYTGKIQSTTIKVGKKLLTGTLSITGDNYTVGNKLGITYSINCDTNLTFLWLRDGAEISNGTEYTITKDDKGTTITVKAVASSDYTGEVISSNSVRVNATAPDAPVVTATAGDTQVTLNWTAPHNGGSDITNYKVTYVKTSQSLTDTPKFIDGIGSDKTKYTVTGLENDVSYTFTVVAINKIGSTPSNEITATPVASSSGGSSSGGSSSGSSSGGSSTGGSTSGNVSNPSTSGGSTTVTTTPSSTISGDTAKAEVTTSTMDKAVKSAIDNAEKNGTKPVIKVEVNTKNADNMEVTLPTSSLKDLANTSNGELVITSDIATVTVDSAALENILNEAGSKVTLKVYSVAKSELNSKQQAVVGNAPVFDFSFVSGNDTISNFGGGTVTVTVSYSLPSNLDEDKVVVYHVDDIGNITPCKTTYSKYTKTVTFTTSHFSKYFIGYDNSIDMTAFYDVSEDRWSAEYIYDLYNRGIINGVGGNMFAPAKNITRAEFVKILAGVAGATSSQLSGSTKFTDVQSDSWYAGYVAWAVNNGITSGTSNTTFSPNANITREQMATMIYRFANSKGITLPKTETAINFTDANTFSSWAVSAISAMQRAGIINGFDDDSFAPAYYATREQACKMLSIVLDIMEK